MEQIYSKNTRKIMQNKSLIEDSLKIKISTKADIVFIEGNPVDEQIALEAIEAINLGFSVPRALFLREDGFILEKIALKPIAKRNNMFQVRARVIGKERKVLDTIESLSNTFISLHDNHVGIIGRIEDVKKASFVLRRIIAGSKQANMYAWLEKRHIEERMFGM